MEKCDVLVVGAGPTGLLLAAELKRHGLDCKIVEKRKAPSETSRALAIQPRTLEIFRLLGIDAPFLRQGRKITGGNPLGPSGPIAHLDFATLDSPFPFILSLPQSQTEQILEEYLHHLGRKVEREVELVGLQEEEDIVRMDLLNAAGEKRQVQAHWVIGCDGAHSFVRKQLNLSFSGTTFPAIFSLADLEISWKYPPNEVFVFLSPEGVVGAIPLPEKNRYRLIFLLKRCRATPDVPPTFAEAKDAIHRFLDPQAVVSHPQWLANFHVNSRLANRYQKGRLFLAGDAAHIHSPIGGQGMNTGLQDAFNLAWKLAFVHKNQLPAHLLGTYHLERYATARRLLKATEFATAVTTLRNPLAIGMRNFFLSCALRLPFLQKRLIRAVSQVAIQYPKSALVRESGPFMRGPPAGSRLSNCFLEKAGKPVELFTLLQKPLSFYLLLFTGYQLEKKRIESLLISLSFYRCPIVPILICPFSQSFDAALLDQQGRAHRTLGAEKSAIYFIRPDTYIAYRQTPFDEARLHAHFTQLTT